ncbi:hypothetical protein [Streptomyces sp. NPDC017991]|uniref:hypothetical protein n=1 Tax=Streptomyces sp. NPDC017991 TaxID=3365026 RepID=UPI00379B32AE
MEHEVNRSLQQLSRVFAQLQKLLTQREDSLAQRKAWTELPPEASPEEHLDRLQVLRGERGRQPGMQQLADRLSGLGDRLLEWSTPSNAQIEMQQSLKSQLREIGQRERLQQQREELVEQPLREGLTEVAQAHLPTAPQQRMLQAAGRVQQLASEMRQPRSDSAPIPAPILVPIPASPAKAATRNITEHEAAHMAALRYEQVRITARRDITAQNEAVAMAKELGYEPSQLADAMQGRSILGSAVVAAAASLHPLGMEGKKSASAASAPQSSTSANAATLSPAPAAAGDNRRSR